MDISEFDDRIVPLEVFEIMYPKPDLTPHDWRDEEAYNLAVVRSPSGELVYYDVEGLIGRIQDEFYSITSRKESKFQFAGFVSLNPRLYIHSKLIVEFSHPLNENSSVEWLRCSRRVQNLLRRNGLRSIRHVLEKSREELKQRHGFGPITCEEIAQKLRAEGFLQEGETWPTH